VRDVDAPEGGAASLGLPHLLLHSVAPDRATYLQRPDLGRKLDANSQALLVPGDYDAALVIADGLSAPAVHHHAVPRSMRCSRC
jgi:ethanolamine ammonia-lyase small subunit